RAAAVLPGVDPTRRAQRFPSPFATAAQRIAASGSFLLGDELAAFESEFGRWLGAPHCVGLSSGAGAVQLALAAAGIGSGDEVLVPAFTAVPTASAVCALGATPVFVDVEGATGTLHAAAAGAPLTDRNRAVIPVHLYGRPAAVADLGPDLGLPVLEDAAQAA